MYDTQKETKTADREGSRPDNGAKNRSGEQPDVRDDDGNDVQDIDADDVDVDEEDEADAEE